MLLCRGAGAMYGGLQIAENISFNGFSGNFNSEESPLLLNRGMKLKPSTMKSNLKHQTGVSLEEKTSRIL